MMPLTFTGKNGSSARFELLLEAYDGKKRVVVATSSEAIEDYGLEAVQTKASSKYDAQQLDEEGRVRVYRSDL